MRVNMSFPRCRDVGAVTAVAAGLALLLGSLASANPIPNLPAKWSQPIGFIPGTTTIYGRDRDSSKLPPGFPFKPILADDFISAISDHIVGVRWWGSYIGDPLPQPDQKLSFNISFHDSTANYPAGPGHPFSLPLALLSLQKVQAFQHWTGFYDKDNEPVYRYEALLPVPFFQIADTEYFINIAQQFLTQPVYQWGWHDSIDHNLDYAAESLNGHDGPWHTLFVDGSPGDPGNPYQYTDLAFEILIPAPASLMALAGALFLWGRRRR